MKVKKFKILENKIKLFIFYLSDQTLKYLGI